MHLQVVFAKRSVIGALAADMTVVPFVLFGGSLCLRKGSLVGVIVFVPVYRMH